MVNDTAATEIYTLSLHDALTICRVNGRDADVFTVGVDPDTLASGYEVQWRRGDDALLRSLTTDQVVVDGEWAEGRGIGVGDTARVLTTAGERRPMEVVGTLDEGQTGLLGGGILVSN